MIISETYLTLWAKLILRKKFVFNSELHLTFTWRVREQPGKQFCTVWFNTGVLKRLAAVCYPSWLTPKRVDLWVQTVSSEGGRGLQINRWSETNESLDRLCRPPSATRCFDTSLLPLQRSTFNLHLKVKADTCCLLTASLTGALESDRLALFFSQGINQSLWYEHRS